jgi:cytoskeletal protein CcmA (bactofilin family)
MSGSPGAQLASEELKMALWKEQSGKESIPPMTEPGVNDTNAGARPADRPTPVAVPVEPARRPAERSAGAPAKESLIAADVTIEGKIEGAGHVRIAGRFKGDVNVEGNVTIESGAHVTGQVHANTVVVSGEVQGNIDATVRVELLETGVLNGDVKAGTLSVAAGSRMRGQADFGWKEKGAGGK